MDFCFFLILFSIFLHSGKGTGEHTVSTLAYAGSGSTVVYAIDLDGDGDMDLLSTALQLGEVTWHENNGTGTFTNHNIQDISANNGIVSIASVDLDGDGDIDIISSSDSYGSVVWLENNGSQSFTSHEIADFCCQTGTKEYVAVDMDGDGDMDVVSGSSALSVPSVEWYENNGTQGFTKHSVGPNADYSHSISVMDVTGDGFLDIVSVDGTGDTVLLFVNNGTQGFTRTVIDSTSAIAPYKVVAVDIDQDGDVDVLTSSTAHGVSLYENDGLLNWTKHSLGTSITSSSIFVIDMDDDGDLDIIVAENAANRIYWLENRGNLYFIEQIVSTTTSSPRSAIAVDLTGDGVKEIVSASSNSGYQVTWYESRLQSAGICGFIAATTVASWLPEWSCTVEGWTSTNPCAPVWPGVVCDNNKISEITLTSYGFTGSLPDSLRYLTSLTKLVLDDNSLSSVIPASLGSLSNLSTLSLDKNCFSLALPTELGLLQKLETLSLKHNSFDNMIPTEFGSLTNLVTLLIDDNFFSNPIPTELGLLTNLVTLSLSNTDISGSIPSNIGFLTNLENIRMDGTSLTNAMPDTMCDLRKVSLLLLNGSSSITCYPSCWDVGSIATVNAAGLQPCASFSCATCGECGIHRDITITGSTIAANAFENCLDLWMVTIPDAVASMGDAVFKNCTSLTSVNLGAGLSVIPDSAFQNCSSLSSIVIPGGITTIESMAFSGCTSLTCIIADMMSISLAADAMLDVPENECVPSGSPTGQPTSQPTVTYRPTALPRPSVKRTTRKHSLDFLGSVSSLLKTVGDAIESSSKNVKTNLKPFFEKKRMVSVRDRPQRKLENEL